MNLRELPDDPREFSALLFQKMIPIAPPLEGMEIYEFRYCLDNLTPQGGWQTIKLEPMDALEQRYTTRGFYDRLPVSPKVDGKIALADEAVHLAQMLFAGLVSGDYPPDWILANFYFDVRGFFFLHRTRYFTPEVLAHLGGKPFAQFKRRQDEFRRCQSVGYKAFREANAEVDGCFIQSVLKLIEIKKTPIILAIAGATAAGKTEIVEQLTDAFKKAGKQVTSIEMDHFLTDRDYREANGIHSEGKRALHFDLFLKALDDITHGKRISIPRYDFIAATSSHDIQGRLRPGGVPVEIEPADIIFIEGNFPFLIEEVLHLIGIKVVYLTDDEVRLKRKWKRDIDYRKKYDLNYFRNRYFRDQFIMAEVAYIPQLETCDLVVDTTGAALWAAPDIQDVLRQGK